MSKIHNNPKLSESRMPVILNPDAAEQWLQPIMNEGDKKVIEELIKPYTEEELLAITVNKLRGKLALGNVPEANEERIYQELVLDID